MLQQEQQPIKKHRRKLPKRSIVDADLVSSKTTDSARIMDDLLLPSEHDRIILSEIFDHNTDRETIHASLLPRVVLGVPNNKRKTVLRTNENKSYKERLYSASNQDFLDLSGHSIIPPSSKLNTTVEKENAQRKVEVENMEDTASIDGIQPETPVNHDTVPAVTPDTVTETVVIPDCDKMTEATIATTDDIDTNHDTTPEAENDCNNIQLIEDIENTTSLDTISIDSQEEDTHQYEQECYVEIRSYAAEYMSSSSSEEEEQVISAPQPSERIHTIEIIPEDAVKNIKQVESPIIPAAVDITPKSTISQAIKTPVVINKEEEDDSEEWMELDDNSSQESTMSEKIFNLMAVKTPAVPMEVITTEPVNDPMVSINTINKHVKLKRLKEKKTLDWIENMSITNKLKMVDKKSRQIALKRQERLELKRQRPYVIRKRIKSIIWTQNTT